MSIYVPVMYCLSIFGFFIIFFSLYLLIFVPTKLDILTRFVIHGHDLTSGITQLYLTLGSTFTLLFPCFSGYTSGFLSTVGMIPLNQLWIQVALLISAGFSVLLSINRMFAISSRMAKYKKQIIITFLVQMICQVFFLFFVSTSLRCGGEPARQACVEKLPYEYPKEMYTFRGCDLSLRDMGAVSIAAYTTLTTTTYTAIGVVCCAVLIQSIRKQAKSSQSTQFLANQRRITFGILYFMIVELVGLGCPFIVISVCVLFNVGTSAISDYAFISMSVYPIFGPYYVLMSNTDYRNKVRGILRKAQELGTRTFNV